MLRSMVLSLTMLLGLNAHASVFTDIASQVVQQSVFADVEAQGLNFKKGDSASYNLNMSIIQGTMVISVYDIVAEGVWLHQDMELGFAGKQKIETLLDPNTGEIKRVIVNGKDEKIPQNNMEVVDTREENVTVPAGNFTCLYIKAIDKSNNNSEAQQWVNLKQVPVMGLVKSIAQSQLGPVTIELTSFKKN